MPETKTFAALSEAGFKVGDHAYRVTMMYANQDDVVRSVYLGTLKTMRAAKRLVELEMAKPQYADAPDGHWTGEVQTGSVVDDSFDDGGYGFVTDWSFEQNYDVLITWLWRSRAGWQ